jgi:hypothetical protein
VNDDECAWLRRDVIAQEWSAERRRILGLTADMPKQQAEWMAARCARHEPGSAAVVFGEALWQLTQCPAATFDEWVDQMRRLGRRRVWASGELAEQARARLGGEPNAPVGLLVEYDMGRMMEVVGIVCGWRDVSFEAFRLHDLEPVRDWLEGRA